MRLRRPYAPLGVAVILSIGGLPGPAPIVSASRLVAQEAVVDVEENLRAEPNGAILGQLEPGTRIEVEGRQGGWTQVTVQGFVFIPSLQVWTDGPFDLVVSAPEGENLRDEPSGRVSGRLDRGTLLDEVRRIPGWIEVRRDAWIWSESLTVEPASETSAPPVEAAPAGPPSAAAAETGAVPNDFVRSRGGNVPLLAAQDGDTVATVGPGVDLPVLARDGSWARVRLDGWVWVPGLGQAGGGTGADEDALLSGISVDDLSTDPEAYRGRLIELDLQFISLEHAEQIRTDFYEGEPFLLTRSLGGQRTFVYVAVPPERVSEVEGISPLETIRVVARVRSASAALTGNPILDLVQLRRERG